MTRATMLEVYPISSSEMVSERQRAPHNPFTTGNPFLGTKLLGFSIGRGSGALKGLTRKRRKSNIIFFFIVILVVYPTSQICDFHPRSSSLFFSP